MKKVLTQKQRRSKIIQGYVGVALFTFFCFMAPDAFPEVPFDAFWLFSSVMILVLITRLLRPLGYAKQDFFDPKVRLDERQQLMRYKAHRVTFHITLSLICVLATATLAYALTLENVVAGSVEVWPLLRPILGGFLFLLVVHYTMPLAMIAWLEPDPPTEEISFRTSGGAR